LAGRKAAALVGKCGGRSWNAPEDRTDKSKW